MKHILTLLLALAFTNVFAGDGITDKTVDCLDCQEEEVSDCQDCDEVPQCSDCFEEEAVAAKAQPSPRMLSKSEARDEWKSMDRKEKKQAKKGIKEWLKHTPIGVVKSSLEKGFQTSDDGPQSTSQVAFLDDKVIRILVIVVLILLGLVLLGIIL